MPVFCLILFLTVASVWFFTNEFRTLFGVYEPTCVVRSSSFGAIVSVVFLLSVYAGGFGDVQDALLRNLPTCSIGCEQMMIMLMASLLSVGLMRMLKVKASICYAFLGALGAFYLVQKGRLLADWTAVISFFAAPLSAFVVAYGIRSLLRSFIRRINVHIFTLSYYMRIAVILVLVMTAIALGVNWGGFIMGIGGMIEFPTPEAIPYFTLATVVLLFLLFYPFRYEANAEPAGIFEDFSIYAVVSVGCAVVIPMLFFSFDVTAGSLGMSPVPLSVSSLTLAAVAGVELAQKSKLIEAKEYLKEFSAVTASPAVSFAFAFIMLYMIGRDPENYLVDFAVMATVMMGLVAMVFSGYVRNQRAKDEATDRVLYAQRQQIYEHSRALNDMELKVVLSENQALHNAVEMKRKEVVNVALSIVEQREFLESLSDTVKKLAKSEDEKETKKLISELDLALKQRLSYERDVDSQYFYAQAESLHEDFNAKLSENFPNLTQQEKRLATLLRLGFSSKYIASLMNITPKSVEISRYRLRQKLNLDKGDNLVNFIKSI